MDRRKFLGTIGAATLAANTALAENNNASIISYYQEDAFAEIKNKIGDKKPLIWVFTGDSITHGALHTYGLRSYVEHFQERTRWEMRRLLDIVINTGISGDTMKGLMSRDEWRIFQLKPDIVSVKIGMNDCRNGEKGIPVFKEALKKLIDRSRKQRVSLLLNTPNLIDFEKDKTRAELPKYVQALRDVAAEHDVPLVDHYAHWQKLTANSSARLQMWLNDGSIHPNGYGHLVLARKIFDDLGIADAKSVVGGRLFVP